MVPIYGKLLKTVVKHQMIKYVEENKLLAYLHTGFREKHSSEFCDFYMEYS